MFEKKDSSRQAGNSEALAANIADLRKARGMTQEQLAEQLGVSAQAVSKWESGKSCPDIGLLPAIAELFGVTLDALFRIERAPIVDYLTPEARAKADPNKLILRVRVLGKDGDKVNVNIPMSLVRMVLAMSGGELKGLENYNIDFEQLLALVDAGCLGNLVDIECDDGDIVKVFVEQME